MYIDYGAKHRGMCLLLREIHSQRYMGKVYFGRFSRRSPARASGDHSLTPLRGVSGDSLESPEPGGGVGGAD